MAITKAKLIADGVITVDNLHASHGITTTHIGEGEKLFYTDARVSSYLTSNNYTTSAGGYFYDATLSANILTFSKSDGTTDSVDLSLYLDDTNLARLVSGTLDALTGIATFTRDDSSTFTIDFSAFLSDANDYVSSGSFNTSTGVLTLTRLGGGTVTVDLDGKYAEASHTHLWSHITDRPTALSAFTNDLGNYGGFLTSFTETDPIYTASSWYTTTNNASNWNTAYGWGNHAGLYSLLGHTHDYLPIGGKAADSELLDGIDSSQFVRNDTFRSQVSNYMDIANVTNGSFRIYDGTTFRGGFGTSRWSDGVSAVDQMSIYSVGDGINFYTGNSNAIRAVINSDYLYHVSDVRSPLFYDSNDTGYYLDLASTSRINAVQFDNIGVGQSVNGSYRIITSGDIYLNANGNGWAEGTWKQRRGGGTWYDVIDSGNIGSQSVNYATGSGNSTTTSQRSFNYLYATDYLETSGAVYGTVFYDNNDRGYYLNPQGFSNLGRIKFNDVVSSGAPVGDAVVGRNYAYNTLELKGYGAEMMIGSQSDAIHINYRYCNNTGNSTYTPQTWYWRNGTSSGFSDHYWGTGFGVSSLRAPIFYDYNDTGYYVNPNGMSSVYGVAIRGDNSSTDTSNQIFFWSNGNSTTSAIGFKANGGYFPNPTGFGDGYNTYLTMDTDGRGWVFRRGVGGSDFGAAYTSGWILNNGVWQANSSMRAPVFYDSNNTGYYLDPHATSNLNTVQANTIRNDGDVSADDGFGIYWTDTASTAYGIYREGGAWSHPYPDLRIAFHTGIKLGANAGYNGIRFYTDYDMSTQVMSVNNASDGYGAGHVHVNGIMHAGDSHRAPIFYDSNDTGYYLDPTSGTVSLKTAGGIVTTGAFGTNGAGGGNLVGRVYGPRGATYSSAAFSVTGAIKIRLPIRSNDTMWSMKVRIYNYSSNNVSEYLIGNYSYSAGAWNYGATYSGTSNSTPRTVRFGNDGSYDCVWIGETSTTWSHPVVSVMDFMGGYANGNVENWDDYWSITFVDIFNTVAASIAPDVNFNEVFSYSYRGNSNVAGTGNASYHPSGIYSTSTNWLYGTMYLNNNAIYDVGNIRSGIFYDKDNTNYYCDPNSLSRLDRVDPNEIYNYGWFRSHTSGYGVYNQATGQHFYSDSGNYWNMGGGGLNGQGIRFRDNYGSTTRGYVYYDQGNNIGFLNQDGNWRLRVVGGDYALADGSSMRAQVFYDSNDTNYYINPGGTSNFGAIQFQGSSNREIYGANVNGYNAVRVAGNWNTFDIMGRVIDWTGSNLHFGDGYNGENHATSYIAIGTAGRIDYMHVGGDGYFEGDVIAYYSDARLKQNIKPISNALDIIDSIRGVTFEWNKKSEEVWKKKEGDKDFGLIAQEVEAVFPMGVVVQCGADRAIERGYSDPDSENYDPLHKGINEEEQYKTVRYDKMVSVAIQAIKEQQEIINNLKQQIEELKAIVNGITK